MYQWWEASRQGLLLLTDSRTTVHNILIPNYKKMVVFDVAEVIFSPFSSQLKRVIFFFFFNLIFFFSFFYLLLLTAVSMAAKEWTLASCQSKVCEAILKKAWKYKQSSMIHTFPFSFWSRNIRHSVGEYYGQRRWRCLLPTPPHSRHGENRNWSSETNKPTIRKKKKKENK